MTIVLPYKPDILDGTELLYSLRSIEKHLTGWTNLVIIGNPLDWYKGEYVTAPDYPGRKQYTIYQKILVACELNNVTDDFIIWNDDHFLLQPLDVKDFKYWHNGGLQLELERPQSSRYHQAVKTTYDLFPSGFNYDIHTPIIYNKNLFKYLFANKQTEICVKSYYCNCHKELNTEYMTDLKIDRLLSYEAIRELIKGRLFFSTSSNAIRSPMVQVLNELYPDKSRYE